MQISTNDPFITMTAVAAGLRDVQANGMSSKAAAVRSLPTLTQLHDSATSGITTLTKLDANEPNSATDYSWSIDNATRAVQWLDTAIGAVRGGFGTTASDQQAVLNAASFFESASIVAARDSD